MIVSAFSLRSIDALIGKNYEKEGVRVLPCPIQRMIPDLKA